MTFEETAILLHAIVTYYPNARLEQTRQTVNAWHKVMDDCDAKQVEDKLLAYVKAGNRFPPTTADLYIQKAPYRPEHDREKTLAHLNTIRHDSGVASRLTAQEKEEIDRVKRDIERSLSEN